MMYRMASDLHLRVGKFSDEIRMLLGVRCQEEEGRGNIACAERCQHSRRLLGLRTIVERQSCEAWFTAHRPYKQQILEQDEEKASKDETHGCNIVHPSLRPATGQPNQPQGGKWTA